MKTRRSKATTPSLTKFAAFSSAAAFSFRPGNASEEAEQAGRAHTAYYTSSSAFLNNVLLRDPNRFKVKPQTVNLNCLPPDTWLSHNFKNRRVLFVLPSNALGSNVAAALFIEAFREHCAPRHLGVCCTQSSSDFFLRFNSIDVYTLWLPKKKLAQFDDIIDLGHLDLRRNIDLSPVDMEGALLEAFGLPPASRFPAHARPTQGTSRPKVGVFPLASSPLRTLPISLTSKLIAAFSEMSDVTVSLNQFQHQGRVYQEHLPLPSGKPVSVISSYASIGALVEAIDACDYAVFADSGPAHMTKLTGTPGMAIYTSASGEVLQGRFTNLLNFTVDYSGAFCQAPCGLAKARQTRSGRIGCMGSLQVSVEELPDTPKSTSPTLVEQFLLNEPIPCIAALAEQFDRLWPVVRQDFETKCF